MATYERRPYSGQTNTVLLDGIHLRTWVREGLGQGPHVWHEVATWPDDRRERWAERACIMETDGALSRDEAERQACCLMADR
jgi:hypothetical protein